MHKNYYKSLLENKAARVIQKSDSSGAVLFWMNRDQRLDDNRALSFAQYYAQDHKKPLIVYFNIDHFEKKANRRQLSFMLDNLSQIDDTLQNSYNIPFICSDENFKSDIKKLITKYKIGTIITDFSPLRVDRKTLQSITEYFNGSVYQVDAHNIVPCWIASDKVEFAAYTIRPKINRLLNLYLDKSSDLKKHPYPLDKKTQANNWNQLQKKYQSDITIPFVSGEKEAHKLLSSFIKNKLDSYGELRNNPTEDNQSNLSVYLHFGMISSRTILEQIKSQPLDFNSVEQFVDELVIRKELSDNFCYYQPNYDTTEAFPNWAKQTIDEHRTDIREYVYTQEQFEQAETHDPLWNAAQLEMVTTGKMHGYMRMYWAKKILEWTASVEHALEIAIYLNDKYELDGNDPNGYAGIAWSIGGVHDRAWFERDVFGKIRYMNFNGCKRKFDVDKYISMYSYSLSSDIK